MRRKRVIHTGPNRALGGVNHGLLIETYQVETDPIVNMEPIPPIASQAKIDIISLEKLIFLLSSIL